MKKLSKLVLVGLLIMGLTMGVIGCGGQEQAEKKKLVVGTEAGFAPFEFSENNEYVGFDMDLIRAIGKAQGYEVEITNMGFDSLIPALNSKKIDCAVAGMSIDPERLKAIDFTEPYFDAGLIIAVAKDTEGITTLDDLKGKRIAGQVGTIGADACNSVKAKDATTDVRIFDGVGEAFMELEKGGIDAVVNDHAVTAYYIKTTGKDKVKMVGEIFSADDQYGIGVKKGNTEILNMLNDGLKKIKDNGEYDKIYEKWFGEKR